MARAEEELVLFGALTHSNRFLSPPRTSPHHSREGGGKAKRGPPTKNVFIYRGRRSKKKKVKK
jgi:hypothetical protein